MIYYNFIRRHRSLNRKTQAGAAGIAILVTNKWRTLIGNAARKAKVEAVMAP